MSYPFPEYVSDCEEEIDYTNSLVRSRSGGTVSFGIESFGASFREVPESFECADSVMLPSFKHQRNDDDWHDQVAQPVQDGGMSASVHCPSLLDVLGALQRGSWSLQHPVVAAFLSRHLPAAAAVCSDDAHTTVAVIVVLRSKFKHSKAGWRVHVKRAANGARAALGDAVYSWHKALVAGALGA